MSVPVGLRKRLAPTGQPPMPLTDQARSLYSSRAGTLPEAVQIGFCLKQIDHPRQICRLENQRPHSTSSDFRFCLDRLSEGPERLAVSDVITSYSIHYTKLYEKSWSRSAEVRKVSCFSSADNSRYIGYAPPSTRCLKAFPVMCCLTSLRMVENQAKISCRRSWAEPLKNANQLWMDFS